MGRTFQIKSAAEIASSDVEERARAGLERTSYLSHGGELRRAPWLDINTDQLLSPYSLVLERSLKKSCVFEPVLHLVLHDAVVVGQGMVVTKNDIIIQDSCWELLSQGVSLPRLKKVGELTFEGEIGSNWTLCGEALLLKRPWWQNYGHWLTDSATLAALSCCLSLGAKVRFITGNYSQTKMHNVVLDTTNLFCGGSEILSHPDKEAWTIESLHYVTPMQRSPDFKFAPALSALRSGILRKLPHNEDAQRRIYVQRPPSDFRRLENEEDVISVCRSLGFTIFSPEMESLIDQAAAFREADVIVGVKGAALTNLIFSRPGSSVLVMSPGDWPDLFFWDICTMGGISYSELFGRLVVDNNRPSMNSFCIDPTVLYRMLTTMLGNVII